MRPNLWIFAFIVLLASCKNGKSSEQSELNKVKEFERPVSTEKIECFSYSGEKDTIFMSLHIKDNSIVEGDLIYSLYEKDKNKGSFRGTLKGDSLFADYKFISEGKTSTREVFFLKTESGIIEGYAPVEGTESKTVFSDHNFKFDNSRTLKRIDCL